MRPNPWNTLVALTILLLLAARSPEGSPQRTVRTQRTQDQTRPGDLSRPPLAARDRFPGTSFPVSASSASSAVKALPRPPLACEANRGQTDSRVRFLSRGPGYTLFLTGTEAVLRLSDSRGAVSGPHPQPLSSPPPG